MTTVLITVLTTGLTWPASATTPPEEFEPEVGGVLSLPMQTHPMLPEADMPHLFPPGIKSVWLEALERDEVDLRYGVIAAFAKAHEYGLPELDDIPPRLREILTGDSSPKVRWAAADALARFDHREAAPDMLAATEGADGLKLVTVVDPALAQWDYEPARERWRQRIEDQTLPLAVRRSAARSLGTVGDGAAVAPLRRIVESTDAPVSLRLDAAEAMGRAIESGLVEVAAPLADGGPFTRTLAATMLRSHRDEAAVALLRDLARDDDPGVASVALRGLGHAMPQAVFEMREELSERPEPNVRYRLVEALAKVPEPGSVRMLGRLLDDSSRAVRWRAREVLIAHGQHDDALREEAWATIDRVMYWAGPAGQEQAVLAAGKLDHTTAAMTIASLLQSDHWRVRRAAANALHELAVPETLPAIYARFIEMTEQVRRSRAGANQPSVAHEKQALIMALGMMRYREAEPVLREYIPKTAPFLSQSRAAAIWALGRIHQDNVDRTLVRTLLQRMTDTESLEPESDQVRHYAAIALGLMGAEQAVATLDAERESGSSGYQISQAFRWAAERITGEARPSIEPPARRPQWFLEPIED